MKFFFICSFLVIFINLGHSLYTYFPSCSDNEIDPNATILKTKYGNVKGACYQVSVNYASKPKTTTKILSWLSIPYAEPPINDLKFKRPIPKNPWNNTIDGTKWPNFCIQIGGVFSKYVNQTLFNSEKTLNITISEDCLYLNVFVPYDVYVKAVINKDSTKKVPVLFWIHGGGFVGGSSSEDNFEPSTLIAVSNVIVVTINYRLGVFGFLHLANTDATGNQGFLDQSLALKWVYENADSFGGDRNRITIQGESAGAFSVGYHLIYQPSWPYFHSAILQSGSPLQTSMEFISSQEATRRALDVSSLVGCFNKSDPSFTNNKVLDCLKFILPKDLDDLSLYYYFSSVFNGNSLAILPSMTLYPLVINGIDFNRTIRQSFLQKKFKKCNILAGTNSKEMNGLNYVSGYFGDNLEDLSNKAFVNHTKFIDMIQKYFEYYPSYPNKAPTTFFEKIYSIYNVPNQDSSNGTKNYFDLFTTITTDHFFRCPTMQLAEYYSSTSISYIYNLAYTISSTPFPNFFGAYHSEDLPFVFGEPLAIKKQPLINFNYYSSTVFNYSALERQFSELIINYWTDFIKYDVPSINFLKQTIWKKFKETTFADFVFNLLFKTPIERNILLLNGTVITNYKYDSNMQNSCKFWQTDSLNL